MTIATPQTPPARLGAKIYQFPLGGRSAVGPRRLGVKPQMRPDPYKVTPTEAGSGWYHDAAIEDARRRHDH